ncbi:MAG: M28 family peptidase [Bryobacteraceae bacterium]
MLKNFIIAAISAVALLAQNAPIRKPGAGWNLAPSEKRYASIDGDHLMQYVRDIVAISRHYRDGHPQFWGRIIGTDADAENAQWLMDQFRVIGLTDIHEQMFDLEPQWMPQSWSVVATWGAKTVNVATAQPAYLSPGTHFEGIDLEAVYAGLASDADLTLSRDVKGKAVFFYSDDTTSRNAPVSNNAIKRLVERGAAAVFIVMGIPGNERVQFYPAGVTVPVFATGNEDGLAVRDLIGEAARKDQTVHVKIRMNVEMVPNLKTGTVWATLPGMTDEVDYVVAHRDAWFDGANDNAAGQATMLGMAEFFAAMPKEQRRRTIVFLGTTGHHDAGAESGNYFAKHKELFRKAALLINSEHTAAMQTPTDSLGATNAPATYRWFAGGKPRVVEIAERAMNAFGVPTNREASPSPPGDIGLYYQFAPSIELISNRAYQWHSDKETVDTISPTGLVAVTRAYAKIIVDTNAFDLKDLRTPEMN